MEIEPQLVTIKQVTVPPLESVPTLKLEPELETINLGPDKNTNLTCMEYFWSSLYKIKKD